VGAAREEPVRSDRSTGILPTRAVPPPDVAALGNVMALQRRAGNRAVASALRRVPGRDPAPGPDPRLPIVQRADPPAPAPAPTSFFFGGYPLVPDADALVKLLGAIVTSANRAAAGSPCPARHRILEVTTSIGSSSPP
jgi:hypothetical protein